MFRKALESILRVSLRVSSCVCYQPSLTLFILYRALLYSVSHWAFTLTQSHKLRWEAHGEIYCHTNKHIHNQDPEKVQWESRCQFSHVALMGAPRVKISTSFSILLALVLLTATDQEPFTWMEAGKHQRHWLSLTHHNTKLPWSTGAVQTASLRELRHCLSPLTANWHD